MRVPNQGNYERGRNPRENRKTRRKKGITKDALVNRKVEGFKV